MECIVCGEEYPQQRYALGYETCLSCGQVEAKQKKFCIMPLHKSNYVVVGNKEHIKLMGVQTPRD